MVSYRRIITINGDCFFLIYVKSAFIAFKLRSQKCQMGLRKLEWSLERLKGYPRHRA